FEIFDHTRSGFAWARILVRLVSPYALGPQTGVPVLTRRRGSHRVWQSPHPVRKGGGQDLAPSAPRGWGTRLAGGLFTRRTNQGGIYAEYRQGTRFGNP